MRAIIASFAAALCAALPGVAHAVLRTCGADPVANTAAVLCAAPSGPCTATSVTVGANIEVTSGGCEFDVGGRALSIPKTMQMAGNGFLRFTNAGDVTVTGTGKLKARGDFVEPNGFIIQGGLISIDSKGMVTLANGALVDVSGDPGGTVVVAAARDVTLTGGSTVQAIGTSSFVDEGGRFADGGSVALTSRGGNVGVSGSVLVSGNNQAAGGSVSIVAARDVSVAQAIDATGGGGDGGEVDIDAGDAVSITKSIDVSSRVGGGFGGEISIFAGEDELGGGVAGGSITVNIGNATLKMNGSDAETSGGDGGDLDLTALGLVRFTGSGIAIQANGGSSFDGSGGSVSIDTGDGDPNRLGALDGDLELTGTITLRSGGTAGDGGSVDLSVGRNLTFTAAVDASGIDSGGEVDADVGGDAQLNGTITAQALSSSGNPGAVDVVVGLAKSGSLLVGKNILAPGGAGNGTGDEISLAACSLTVADGVKIDGRGGVDPAGHKGGSTIELVSPNVMQLRANSQYLAQPGGAIFLTHPPGKNPVRGTGVTFNPPAQDNPVASHPGDDPYPSCPVCGDGARQPGEACDKAPSADGACCNADCSAFLCVTPTATPTPAGTRTVTPTVNGASTATPTPSRTVTPAATTPTASSVGATDTPTAAPTATRTATSTLTPTPIPTTTPAAVPAVDHYKCYKARPAPGTSRLVAIEARLEDAFESKLAKVVKTDSLCVAVGVDGHAIQDPQATLQCYAIRDAAGQPRSPRRTVDAADDVATTTLQTRDPQLLCLPASRDGGPTTAQLAGMKCYAATPVRDGARFVPSQISLVDAFDAKATRVVEPTSVCVGVARDGASLVDPEARLHCYEIKDAPGQPRFARRTVGARTDLGAERLVLQKPRRLCVPATHAAPPVCGDGIRDANEQCDDGNQVSGDGCSAACVLESCGNGRIDSGEACDAGPMNGLDQCCSTTCQLVDADDDGICDRDDLCPADADNDSDGDGYCVGLAFRPPLLGGGDPCSRLPGTAGWIKPRVALSKLDGPAGARKLVTKGAFIIPTGGPPTDPVAFGLHLRLVDQRRALVYDARIPGGAFLAQGVASGWKASGVPPAKWVFLDKVRTSDTFGGVTKIVLTRASSSVPGLIKIAVIAPATSVEIAPGSEPVTASIELNPAAVPSGGSPGVDQCADAVFSAPPAVPNCRFGHEGSKLTCS